MILKIIPATSFDTTTLQTIARETFVAAFADQNSEGDIKEYLEKNMGEQQLLKELTTPGSEFYLAYDNHQLIGYLKLNFGQAQTDLQDPKSMEIERIYVLPGFYGKQAGQQLLDFGIQRALDSKMQSVWLGVWEHNGRAIRFYEKNGFREFGRHKFLLGSDEQTDLLLLKNLF